MSMELENVESILYEALKRIDAEERKAYLEATCGINTQLRADIDSLLQAYEDEAGILKAPADLLEEPIITLTEGPGTVIGRYKLLEKIGEGGMAVVYMAEQREPIRRKVALKIIKLGMDTRQVIARFEAERQALAMMDHPNIAKVLDAGATETGRPYFVMELVTGITITEYCDKKKLTMPERLDLFVQVCNAVQHAHQKGIIHRDIKPSNVMVTLYDGKPVAKVIDFGIAKAVNQRLTEKTLFTRYAHMIGTPAYMSPEQAEMRGLDIDRRTDIYSLGVLLYELLTGTTPFDAEELREAGYVEMQRIIREEKPAKPSTKLSAIGEMLHDIAEHRRSSPELLVKLVSGDLDWIVMKALEKDRIRRYETVSALAMDIQMYLENEPVQARPPNAMYRLKKFLHKHRQPVAAVGAMSVLLAVIMVFLVMWNQKRIQVKEAEPLRDRSILSQARESFKGDVSSLRTLPEIDPSLVGWWKFDEDSGNTAVDYSGNGFDITLHNITWEDGVFGGAVHFHGVGYGDVGNFRYSDNAITVCAWVWHDAFRIGKFERYITVAGSAVIRKEFDGPLNFYIDTDGNIRSLQVNGVLQEGQWHHVAGTWDGLTQRLYIDGVEIASQAPGGVLGETSNVMISSTQDEPLNGLLDEVRIYNRALTQDEIQFVMQGKEWPFALVPTPADGALHMDTGVNLSWFAGATAVSHNVYFGIDEQAVSDADTSDTTGIYRGNQSVTGYTPPEDLEFGRTYYWRIDEVESNGTTIHKGDIWRFRVADSLSVLAEPNFVWNRAAYWDTQYPALARFAHEWFLRNAFEFVGYKILDADQLKTWMDARIADGMPGVVVFCRDMAPATVVESASSTCTLRRYLDAGGKIVWYGPIPMFYQGHSDGTRTDWGNNGSINVLGFDAAVGPWDREDEVVFTADGTRWGLTETWRSVRPTSPSGLRVLAKDASGNAAAWVKHFVPGDSYRGFVRLYDQFDEPNFNDIRRAAEYPHVPEPIDFNNQNRAENEDDIISTFFYPRHRNPDISSPISQIANFKDWPRIAGLDKTLNTTASHKLWGT